MVALTGIGANVSTTKKRSAKQVVKRSEKPRCDWCKRRFEQARSDQRFCDGNCRRDACERRKQETIKTLAAVAAPYGLSEDHIRDCAENYLTRLKNVLVMLNYTYVETEKRWMLRQ